MSNGTKTIIQKQQPVPINRETFTAGGKTYEILRFPRGLNLKEAIEVAEGMRADGLGMLTSQKAREIRDNAESSAIFKERLKPGEWAFVRDPDSESKFLAAYLARSGFERWLKVDNTRPVYLSRVLILEMTGSEAAIPQSGQAETGQLFKVPEQQE